MLHRVRRAESMLLSYERTGWLDDVPAVLTGRNEIRPAAELGPIILCLDTSGTHAMVHICLHGLEIKGLVVGSLP